ncbi:hypothetical protein J6590_102567, partial [Homalodisca vitripennis]
SDQDMTDARPQLYALVAQTKRETGLRCGQASINCYRTTRTAYDQSATRIHYKTVLVLVEVVVVMIQSTGLGRDLGLGRASARLPSPAQAEVGYYNVGTIFGIT